MSNRRRAEEAEPGLNPTPTVGSQDATFIQSSATSSNREAADEGETGWDPSWSIRSQRSSAHSVRVEGRDMSVGRKWTVKNQDNWWCPISVRSPWGAVRFKLTAERDKEYDGVYLSGYSEDDAVQLEDVLRDATHVKFGQLQDLTVPYEEISVWAVKTFGGALHLHENPTPVLESLSCFGNYTMAIAREGCFEHILDGVWSGKLNKLKAFRWERNCLDDAGLKALAELIEEDYFPFLTELSLSYNNFGPTGVVVLCSALQHVGGLRLLNLGGNELGNGHLCLAHAMECGHLQALETIGLDRSGMGDADYEAYEKAMSSGKLGALKEINFGDNCEIGDAGVKALRRGLQSGKVKNLERLSLRRVHIRKDGLAPLANAMEEVMLTSLVHLQLDLAGFREMDIRYLAKALESGNVDKLRSLTFSGVQKSADVKPLVAAFSVNTALICDLNAPLHGSLRRKYELQVERNRRKVYLLEEMGGKVVPATFGKVYLCGNPEVGKTTLRKSLQRSYLESLYTREGWKQVEPRTRGIEICKIVSKGCAGENDVRLTLWDMAGQDDYHLVHNSFLPGLMHGEGKATMFVVMCTSKNISNAEDELESWFKFIASSVSQNIGNRRHVFVVVNRWDGDTTKAHSAHLWKSMLSGFSEKFEKHLYIKADPLIVDARKKKSVERIKRALIKHSREMLKTEKVSEICQFIQTNLSDWSDEQKEFPVLSWKDFGRRIRRKGANWSELALEAAVKYLDEAGELIYIQKESIEEKLIVLYPNWFCKHIMGYMFLPESMAVQAEQIFRKNVDSRTGSISLKDFTGFFQSLAGACYSSRVDDLLTILLWRGFCYKGWNENVFIPSLIEESQTVDHLWEIDSMSGDRADQWVMGYQVEYAQSELALAPIALWHKFQVELAQTLRFNGQPDNDFVVGKYFTYFKVDYMVVRINVNADEKCPTFDCIEILVKPFLSNGKGDLDMNTRKQCQLDLARDIVEILLDKWKDVCPGIDSIQRVVWPWPVSYARPEIKERQNVEVNEMKRRVQESSVVKYMQWHVGENDSITEDQLLCTKDKEVVVKSLRGSIHDVQAGVKDAIELQIISPKDEVNEAWIPNSLEDEIGSANRWRSMSMEKKTSEYVTVAYQTKKGEQCVFDRPSSSLEQPPRDDELLRKVLDTVLETQHMVKEIWKVSKEVSAKLHQVMTIHTALHRKIEDIERTFLQDRERTCPKFLYMGKRNSGAWIRLKDAISSTVSVKVHVYFACEANYNADGPHEVKNQQGIDVSELKDWARKILPLVKVSLTILLITAKVTANLAAPGTGLIIGNFAQWQQASSLAEGISLATGFSVEKLDELAASNFHPSTGSSLKDLQGLYGRSRKIITEMLAKLTPQEFEQKVGLRKVCLKHSDGTLRGVVWICADCFENYRKSNLISELD